MAGHFRKDRAPDARTFYQSEGYRLGRANREGWTMAQGGDYPCHRSKSKKSLSVNLHSGGFFCHGCHANGGDLIDYVRLRDGCDSKTAAQRLGCWDANGTFQPQPKILVPYLTLDFAIEGQAYSVSVRDEPRNYEDKIRRCYCDARDRLTEIGRGDSEKYEGERESCWERMVIFFNELRELGSL